MRPILFDIPLPFDLPLLGNHIPIYSYGLMLVIGFICACRLARALAGRVGLDGELFVNAGLLALVTGIIGARVSHVLENWAEFSDPKLGLGANVRNMLNLRAGGLTYYGGFLLAFPTLVIYAIRKKIPVRTGMDIIAPCLMVGLGFGRIGCFLNGCCYGATCSDEFALGVRFPYHSNAYVEQVHEHMLKPSDPRFFDGGRLRSLEEVNSNPVLRSVVATERSLPVQPAQLYSAANCFMLVALLYAYFTLPHAWGRGFAIMLMLEGLTRFLLELLRVEPGVVWGGLKLRPVPGLSLSMLIGLGLVALGAALWVYFGKSAADRATTGAGLATPAAA